MISPEKYLAVYWRSPGWLVVLLLTLRGVPRLLLTSRGWSLVVQGSWPGDHEDKQPNTTVQTSVGEGLLIRLDQLSDGELMCIGECVIKFANEYGDIMKIGNNYGVALYYDW